MIVGATIFGGAAVGVGLLAVVVLVGLFLGPRWTLWVGRAISLGCLAVIPYWLILWQMECTGPFPVVGDRVHDNDATCRALFFGGLPFVLVFTFVSLIGLALVLSRAKRRLSLQGAS